MADISSSGVPRSRPARRHGIGIGEAGAVDLLSDGGHLEAGWVQLPWGPWLTLGR